MTIILKPTYACNFRCKYCYLSNDTKVSTSMFNIEFFKNFILQLKDVLPSVHSKTISFIWHGGEPLLWGKQNYRTALDFVHNQLSDFNIKTSIQTNLSLLDEEYIDIFTKYNVKIGFSLDGNRDINDSQRIDSLGQPTYNLIMNKLALCREKGLEPGCIIVGSRKHIGHIRDIYEFMKKKELNFKFNPIFVSGEARKNQEEYGITTEEYAQMCIELFDLWYDDVEGKIQESNFIEIASNMATMHVSGCMFKCNCQDSFMAITPSGDVMPCGRFCDENLNQYSYGNLHTDKLVEILSRIKKSEIYRRAEYIAESSCSRCKWYNICHGGCLHDGFLKSGDFRQKSILCPAYKKIFSHIEKKMTETGLLICKIY